MHLSTFNHNVGIFKTYIPKLQLIEKIKLLYIRCSTKNGETRKVE